MDSLLQDLRYAVRSLVRNPAFSLAAVLTLALGIGANIAVFAVADASIFRPLPYRDPERLVDFLRIQDPGTARQRFISGMTRDDVALWGAQSHIFDAIETYRLQSAVVGDDEPERVSVTQLSIGMLNFLQVSPILGRGFRPEEMILGSDGVALISEALWRTRFGADPSALGRTLALGNRPRTIVGVMPSTFWFPTRTNQVWIPLPNTHDPRNPAMAFVTPLARLRPGIRLADAQGLVDITSARLESEQPRPDSWRVRLTSLDEARTSESTRLALMVLVAVVGLVLLIACANVANLFLARSVARQRENAIRSAIGASPLQLVRQFLVEGIIIAALGAVAAGLAAWLGIGTIGAIAASTLRIFNGFEPELNRRVLAFTTFVAVLTGLACALIPAVTAINPNVRLSVLSASRAAGLTPGHRGVRQGLAGVEVALTFVLLLGAALLANSFIRMVQLDVGFDADKLLTVSLQLPADRYAATASHEAAYQYLLEGVRTVPGVVHATATGSVPPDEMFVGSLEIEGVPAAGTQGFYNISITPVSGDHFEALGIPVVEGRSFEPTDASGSTPVAIIDRETARRHWPEGGALGKRIKTFPASPWRTIVGVVGRVKLRDFNQLTGVPQTYEPIAQRTSLRNRTMAVRTSAHPNSVMASVRERIRAYDRSIYIAEMRTVEDRYAELFTPSRLFLTLMSVFAFVALALAAIGLYGVLAYSVSLRTQEIGIRRALGADSAAIRGMVVRDAALPVAAGLVVGVVASQWASKFIRTMLFEITPHDTLTTIGVVVFLVMVALAAAYFPARRATRVDPIVALRTE